MNRRTARGNRLGLILTGLALAAAGAAALARGLGAAPGLLGASGAPVTDRAARDFADGHSWFWPAVAAATVTVGLLALRWLAVQARPNAVRDVRLELDPTRGTTTLPGRAVTAALEDDLSGGLDIRRADAVLSGTAAHPRLRLTVTLEPSADPAAAKHAVKDALEHAAQALETSDLHAIVRLRTAR
ncbi:alkaline shock response membrane anchor protein AmaP [Actinomadura opuntiae]|uniref:alkaline shock response membrane anchor protein AmaP n=1 Tax=Actinomadura sp. OS1-43 TaxID=604315 RepID=UPI00255ABF03|nr:alkaline shock response membrane anchor protein AmaP [Actinomadura sp. OS1-43]MDL4818546.1 alkaline shock response membrane anchor protein AmaP [Actinomadura sp. OS1-43]